MTQPHRFAAQPAAPFAALVHSYWGINRAFSKPDGFTIYPDRFSELLFFDESTAVEEVTERKRLAKCTFVGVLTKPLHLRLRGQVRCASIRFYPWGARRLIQHLEKSPKAPWCDASKLVSSSISRVQGALKRGEWSAIPGVFDAILGKLLVSPPTASEVAAARAFAFDLPGQLGEGTEAIAKRLGYSRRQVERQVRTATQISPKQLSSLTRFEFVRDSLWSKPDLPLARLAIDAGYADQAHMTRYFKRFAGQTPTEFRDHCRRLKQVTQTRDVAFVQDPQRKKRQAVGHANQITDH